MLGSPTALRSKVVREAAFRLLAAMALRYQQLDVVAGALVDLLSKHDHLPSVLAELAEFAAQQHGNGQLVRHFLHQQDNALSIAKRLTFSASLEGRCVWYGVVAAAISHELLLSLQHMCVLGKQAAIDV